MKKIAILLLIALCGSSAKTLGHQIDNYTPVTSRVKIDITILKDEIVDIKPGGRANDASVVIRKIIVTGLDGPVKGMSTEFKNTEKGWAKIFDVKFINGQLKVEYGSIGRPGRS